MLYLITGALFSGWQNINTASVVGRKPLGKKMSDTQAN